MRTITRQGLYEQVWRTPTRKLKKIYGISDVAIAKHCKKLNIPKPPRGYWEKIRNGRPINRSPLPPPGVGVPAQITIPTSINKSAQFVEAISNKLAPLIRPEVFTLPDNFHSVSPLVKKTHDALRAASKQPHRADRYPRVYFSMLGTLDIRVSTENVDKALKIMEALTRGLQTKGYSLVADGKDSKKPHSTHVDGLDHPVRIYIEELAHQVKHVPTANESQWQYTKFDYQPTGKLHLIIDEYYSEALRRRWTINDNKSLGTTLASFVNGIAAAAKALKDRSIRLQSERQLSEIRRLQEAEEESRRHEFTIAAAKWNETQRLRGFLTALKTEIDNKKLEVAPNSQLGLWLAWANRYVEALDPIPVLVEDLRRS